MKQDIGDRLTEQFRTVTVRQPIHRVPPHEVYEILVDGQRAVCKLSTGPTGRAGIEGRVMGFLNERTTVPVPAILHCGSDHFVAAWHPDAPAPAAGHEASEAWARAAGTGLARLHAETDQVIDTYGRFTPSNGGIEVSGDPSWHAAVLRYLRERSTVLARYGHEDMAAAAITLLESRQDAFAGVGSPVCCHGWATPEHVSVGDGEVRCLVDFEHALAAPAEFDYWRTVTPAFGSGEVENGRRAFREGYESVRRLPSGVDNRRPFFLLLNMIYYFESLYVQDQHDPDERDRRAEQLREQVRKFVDRLA